MRTILLAMLLTSSLAGQHVLQTDDLNKLQTVGAPQVSPDGKWVLYTVGSTDKAADKRDSHIWMVNWDGSAKLQMTNSSDGESAPKWSPDGLYISFLSARPGKAKGTQIWLLDRRGGEAAQMTEFKENISDYQWSPDAKRLAVVLKEKDEPEADTAKPDAAKPDAAKPATPPVPKPIVLDRYHFKQDIQGYLTGTARSRIFLFDIATKKAEPLTPETEFDETGAAWSPDGTKIAFVSNRQPEWDRSPNSDVWVASASPKSAAKRLTSFPGPDGGRLAWSPDSRLIAYTQGSEPKLGAYNQTKLAVVPADGGEPRLLTEKLDRNVTFPEFTEDGKAIVFLVADDRSEYPARISVSGGAIEKLLAPGRVVSSPSRAGGHTAVLSASDQAAPEVFAMEGGSLRKLTGHNDAFFAELKLGAVEDIGFKSKDGTDIHGLLVKPPDFTAGTKYPTLLRIHGGPNGQDAHQFFFENQFLAAHGYVVVAVNYRGSSGRGQDFQKAIFADWGRLEVQDLLAGVDYVVKMGIADPARLGIGGWSYGGILTDYTIATDTRFKAAISGAGSANQITMYGIDQYTFQYDNEIGAPWVNPQRWIEISYPFFHADRIHTPTLFMGGDRDFNVPIQGGEQMYQALQSLKVPTQMVIYPGQFHGFTRPSFLRDRLDRYVAWYDKWLKPAATLKAD
jgi:dipeptidyl aminopeptidase/acylaminoacyl peptidase